MSFPRLDRSLIDSKLYANHGMCNICGWVRWDMFPITKVLIVTIGNCKASGQAIKIKIFHIPNLRCMAYLGFYTIHLCSRSEISIVHNDIEQFKTAAF